MWLTLIWPHILLVNLSFELPTVKAYLLPYLMQIILDLQKCLVIFIDVLPSYIVVSLNSWYWVVINYNKICVGNIIYLYK